MKPILPIILGLLCLNVPVEAQMPEFFPLKPKSSIDIELANDWELRFGLDGAGMLGFGASAQHSTTFPPHTIDEQLITQLFGSLSTNKTNPSDIAVHIVTPRPNKYPVYYTPNRALVESLFKLGIERGDASDSVQFNRVLTERPPWGIFSNSLPPSK